MDNNLTPYQPNQPARSNAQSAWQRWNQEKELAKIDNEGELQARRDLIGAKLREQGIYLQAILDKRKSAADIDVAEDMMNCSVSLGTYVSRQLEAHPGMELHFRGIQNGVQVGFETRMMRRALD